MGLRRLGYITHPYFIIAGGVNNNNQSLKIKARGQTKVQGAISNNDSTLNPKDALLSQHTTYLNFLFDR